MGRGSGSSVIVLVRLNVGSFSIEHSIGLFILSFLEFSTTLSSTLRTFAEQLGCANCFLRMVCIYATFDRAVSSLFLFTRPQVLGQNVCRLIVRSLAAFGETLQNWKSTSKFSENCVIKRRILRSPSKPSSTSTLFPLLVVDSGFFFTELLALFDRPSSPTVAGLLLKELRQRVSLWCDRRALLYLDSMKRIRI